ncbi:hypothetical protein [Falsirhodobacter deserti]|uniref:hypothetical protein n=1 Tax=Falsirhodobacter deserti TaxID=1365611 RepID=UPI000FE3B2BA|nr:hypothetical protein [Falsirhodobacter deserti]
MHPTFAAIARTATLLTLGYLVASAALVHDLDLFFHEGHGVEQASVGLLVGAIILWFWLAGEYRWREWQLPAALALMLARELDFDKQFTDSGLLKLTTYTRDGTLETKVFGGLAILFTLWVGLRILRRNLPLWWSRLRQGAPDAWMLAIAMVCGVLAKTLDGLGRKLLDFDVHLPAFYDMLSGRLEEVLEGVCYWLIVLAIARLVVPSVRHEAGLAAVPAE